MVSIFSISLSLIVSYIAAKHSAKIVIQSMALMLSIFVGATLYNIMRGGNAGLPFRFFKKPLVLFFVDMYVIYILLR